MRSTYSRHAITPVLLFAALRIPSAIAAPPADAAATPDLTRTYDAKADRTYISTKPQSVLAIRGRVASAAGGVSTLFSGKTVTTTPPGLLISLTIGRIVAIHTRDWKETPMVILCDGKRIVARPLNYDCQSRGGMDYETITFGLETAALAPAGEGKSVTAEVGPATFEFSETFKLGIHEMMAALGVA